MINTAPRLNRPDSMPMRSPDVVVLVALAVSLDSEEHSADAPQVLAVPKSSYLKLSLAVHGAGVRVPRRAMTSRPPSQSRSSMLARAQHAQ